MDALRAAIEEFERVPASGRLMPTFAEFFERWYNEVVQRDCEPKTAERYRELAQYAIRLFGDVPLDRLTTEQLRTDMNRLLDCGGRPTKEHPQGRPLAPKTVRHIGFLIQGCLEQALDWEYLATNPMKKVKKPRVPKRRPKIVDSGGFEKLLRRAADSRLYPVIVLAMATGMRRGEMLALEWSDLDWERGMLEVSKSLEETDQSLRVKGTKSNETRRFSVPGEVLKILREHKSEQDRHRELYGPDYANLDLIFSRPDGSHLTPSNFGKRASKLMRSAGLAGITLHSLRHSHASELLSQGAPITAVAERLGHASPNITLGIYSHALPADNQAAAKLWNDAMAEVIQESRKRVAAVSESNGIKKASSKPLILVKSAS